MNSADGLDKIFRPKSIAVIGATSRPGTIGREILHNLVLSDFKGQIFPVNPGAQFLHSMKCYPSIGEVPDAVDMAVIVVRVEPSAAARARNRVECPEPTSTMRRGAKRRTIAYAAAASSRGNQS